MTDRHQPTEKQLARIKKMLALANDAGATEGEREAALHHATKMLQKYNMEMADLPEDMADEAREQQDVTISADTWARYVCQSIAGLFFCKYILSKTKTAGKDKHIFVGRQSNVITAMHMSEYLIKNIKKEASKRYKSPTSPEGRSFCVGTVDAIRRRVVEMKEKGADATVVNPGTAVVLANRYQLEADANEAFLKQIGMDIVTHKARTDNSLRTSAYHDGKAHGATVGLNNQIAGGTVPKRTLIGN